MKIPIISLAILGGQAAWAYSTAGGRIDTALSQFSSLYTGFVPHANAWAPHHLAMGYGPWVIKRFAMAFARPRLNMRGIPISLS